MQPFRTLRRIAAVTLVALGTCTVPALATAADVAVTPASSTVVPGTALGVSAQAPPEARTDSVTEQITQAFNPEYLRLTKAGDVTGPEGWALSYSTDGTAFSTTAPTTAAGWAAVRAVRTQGALNAAGAEGNRQIATATESVTTSAPGVIAPGGGGDGWDVAFDDQGHVFNMFHHLGGAIPPSQPITNGTGALDCHVTTTGGRCAGNWPYNVNSVMGLETNSVAAEWVDTTNKHVWFPTGNDQGNGFACIDISNIAAPGPCGGSTGTAYTRLAASVDNGGYGWPGNSTLLRGYNTGNAQLAQAGGRIYSWDRDTGTLICIDAQANGGLGAECPGGPVGFTGIGQARWEQPTVTSWDQPSTFLFAWGGRIYGSAGAGGTTAVCIVAATNAPCAGWASPRTLTHYPYTTYVEPNATGTQLGACFVTVSGPAECFDAQGAAFAGNAALGTGMKERAYATGPWRFFNMPTTVDSRVFGVGYTTGGSPVWSRMWCLDAATSGACAGFSAAGVVTTQPYAAVADPSNQDCFWINSDGYGISTIDSAGSSPCSPAPPTMRMSAAVAVPRLGCTASPDPVKGWRSFTLTAPTLGVGGGATSATLTVRGADGGVIAGWGAVPIPDNGVLDISGLPVAASGQQPSFQVNFTGRQASATTATATVKAVGEPPMLCTVVTAQAVACPHAGAPAGSMFGWTSDVTGTGSVTSSSSQLTSFGAGKASATMTGVDTENCREAPTPKPKVARVRTSPTGDIVMQVEVPGPGKVQLIGTRGKGIRACTSIRKTMTKAGTTVLTCRLNASTRAVLRRRSVCITIAVVYSPGSGTPSRTVRRICLSRRGMPAVTG